MQGAHPVPQMGQQTRSFHKGAYPLVEVVHRRIDQRHHQHLLVICQLVAGDDIRSQPREDPCLAAAGHCRDSHLAAAVSQDFLLFGSWDEGHLFSPLED